MTLFPPQRDTKGCTMADTEEKQVQGKRILPITILDILQRETDEAHGMEASEIRVMLERDYGLKATEKTIREHCKALQGFAPLGRKVIRLNRGDIGPDGQAISAEDTGWAVEPYFDAEQARLLAGCIARVRDDAAAGELVDKLVQLSGPQGRDIFEAASREEQPQSEQLPAEEVTGLAIDVKVRTASPDTVTDRFADASAKQVAKGMYEVKFRADSEAICQWALHHGDQVEVLKPKKLRKILKAQAKALGALYR